MADGKAWEFRQLGEPNKVLQLTGWAAPHGRVRQDAVVRDGIELRHAEYYYPGNSQPTRHVFGHKWLPWEIRGRFRDRSDGTGFALSKTLEVKQFVADGQRVRVSWGDIAAVEGLITRFDPGREAEGETEWTMEIHVDADLYAKEKPKKVKPPVSTKYVGKLITDEVGKMFGGLPEMPSSDFFSGLGDILSLPANIAGSLLEYVDGFVSIFSGTVGQFQKAANGLSSLEKATFAELNKLINVSVQMRGTLSAVRESYTGARVDLAMVRERAFDNANFWTGQSAVEGAIAEMVAQLATTERDAQLAIRGRGAKSYVARGGDTMEQISVQMYGSPDRAGDLGDASGLGPGARPSAGLHLIVPP